MAGTTIHEKFTYFFAPLDNVVSSWAVENSCSKAKKIKGMRYITNIFIEEMPGKSMKIIKYLDGFYRLLFRLFYFKFVI